MKYRIYELVTPEHLQGSEPDGYHMRTITRYVLEEPEAYELREDFDSMEDAFKRIEDQGESYTDYTIHPYIRVRD
tara:strand:+ start:783 stop:1007 length:225 start_codon:yes stop_codon:yes gene_type:complete